MDVTGLVNVFDTFTLHEGIASIYYMFGSTTSLLYLSKNFKLPKSCITCTYLFGGGGGYSSSVFDITNFFDNIEIGKNSGKTIRDTFYAKSICGTLPADKLWNDLTWAYRNSKTGMFGGCDTSRITNANEIPSDWK